MCPFVCELGILVISRFCLGPSGITQCVQHKESCQTCTQSYTMLYTVYYIIIIFSAFKKPPRHLSHNTLLLPEMMLSMHSIGLILGRLPCTLSQENFHTTL